MSKGKYLLLGAGVVGLVAGGTYLLNLKRLANELEVLTKAVIYKVTLSGMVLRVDVTLKNPTAGTLSVKYPFVRMMYNDSTFASSEVKDKDYEIPKFGQIQLEPIYINLSFISLASSAPGVLKDYRTNGKISLNIKTTTTINNRFGYNKTDTIVAGSGNTSQKA